MGETGGTLLSHHYRKEVSGLRSERSAVDAPNLRQQVYRKFCQTTNGAGHATPGNTGRSVDA